MGATAGLAGSTTNREPAPDGPTPAICGPGSTVEWAAGHDLVRDMAAVLTSRWSRLYGRRSTDS
jgi:hypothetical protein